MHTPTPGRRRTLDRNKKRLFCDAVSRGASMTEAAVTVGVSLRTVQREARLDPDFDQQLRLAHTDKPDPLAIMQSAARTHWRAAAWLLERTKPEDYGRRPASSCSPYQFEEALKVVIDAALRLAPPENRAQVYAELTAASETAFKAVFPNYGPYGRHLVRRLPATPLADEQRLEVLGNPPPHLVVPDRLDVAPEVGWVDRAAATHHDQTNEQRWVPAPQGTAPTEGDELATNSAPHSRTPTGRCDGVRAATPWIHRQRKFVPQRGEVAPALLHSRSIRSRPTRSPKLARLTGQAFCRQKQRFATKLTAAHLNAATAAGQVTE